MAKPSEQRYSILAVDDNRNALEIIRRILGQSGYEVITCEGVPDAVNILKDQRIDLVITDMKMPRHSGFELVRYGKREFLRYGRCHDHRLPVHRGRGRGHKDRRG